jgi:hypothetical protein
LNPIFYHYKQNLNIIYYKNKNVNEPVRREVASFGKLFEPNWVRSNSRNEGE